MPRVRLKVAGSGAQLQVDVDHLGTAEAVASRVAEELGLGSQWAGQSRNWECACRGRLLQRDAAAEATPASAASAEQGAAAAAEGAVEGGAEGRHGVAAVRWQVPSEGVRLGGPWALARHRLQSAPCDARCPCLPPRAAPQADLAVLFRRWEPLPAAAEKNRRARLHSISSADDEEEDEPLFEIPASASPLQRRVAMFLRNKCRLPDFLLVPFCWLSLRAWALVLLWCLAAPVVHGLLELGPIYVLATCFLLIFFNLGRRKPGESSAYSIFNEGFRELPGTLNAARLDEEIRGGRF